MPSQRQPILSHGRLGFTRRAFLIASTGALLPACSTGGGGPAETSLAGAQTTTAASASTLSSAPIKVGLLLPLTKPGEAGQIATALKQSAELALFDVSGANIALIPRDTAGTAEGAAAAAQAVIAEGAELLIGPLYAQEVLGAAPVARQANIPVLAFSSDRKVAGNGVYLLSFLAGADMERVVTYAVANGKRTFAALVPQTPYGSVVEQSFRAAIERSGGHLVAAEHYTVDANGLAEPINRLRADVAAARKAGAAIDALFVPGARDTLPIVASMLPNTSSEIKAVKLLGSGGWDYPTVGQEAGLEGGWFAGPDPAAWQEFAARYTTTYGSAPVRLATLAYDAVTLALALATNPQGQRFTGQTLTRASGFAGLDGLFRLRPDGTCERGLAILEVTKFGPHVIDPAPSAFTVAQF